VELHPLRQHNLFGVDNMNESERELDLMVAELEQENKQLRAKVVEYENLIRDLTDALRAQGDKQ